MRSMRVRTVLLAAAGLALAGCIALPMSAPAATLSEKQAQAAELDREVSKLEDRYGDLQERWRGALVELKAIEADRKDAERKLQVAKRDLRRAKRRLQERAIAIYQDGNGSSELMQVAEAGSLKEFFDRIDTIQRVGTQDADILGRVRDAAERVEEQEQRLSEASKRQTKVVHRADKAKRKMHKVLSQKQAKLGSVTAEIRAIMAQQRAAAAAEAAADARANAATFEGGGTLDNAIDTSAGGGGGSSSSSSSSSSSTSSSSGGSSFVPLPPASGTAAAAASIAMGKSGAPYEYGAAGPNTFDCSGLVVWAFAQAGRPGLPHSTYSLIGMGVEVPMDQAQVGDLVFTNNAGHMGIYVGGGSFVHAPRTGRTVTVEGLGYYTVVSVRRI
jgi:cell wall-associated NlpC family hydrolase